MTITDVTVSNSDWDIINNWTISTFQKRDQFQNTVKKLLNVPGLLKVDPFNDMHNDEFVHCNIIYNGTNHNSFIWRENYY